MIAQDHKIGLPSIDDARRLRAYMIGLLLAFGLYFVVYGLPGGWSFSFLCAAVLVMLALSIARPSFGGGAYRFASLSAIIAAAVALSTPLLRLVYEGEALPVAVADLMVWPQFLVLLFAGRMLAEISTLRFAIGWNWPLYGARMATQSMLAALVSGCALTLVFYKFVGDLTIAADRMDPWAIVARALAGQTMVHVAIIILFFVTVAAILDAALVLASDRTALGEMRRLCRIGNLQRPDRAEVDALLSNRLNHLAHTRTAQFIREGMAPAVPIASSGAGGNTIDGFHRASRRMVRALLSFLPLLGFLGTVIGLTAAIGGLPRHLGPAAEGSLDISASLVGLAVKFETTLLGLAGGLVASLLLALLERREGELVAECSHLIRSLTGEAKVG